ncbi:MAG: hypothetical protein AAF035_12370 [Pseudomonadota bacterium]
MIISTFLSWTGLLLAVAVTVGGLQVEVADRSIVTGATPTTFVLDQGAFSIKGRYPLSML